MSNTKRATAHEPNCPQNKAASAELLSLEGALTLLDIQARACLVERLLYAWLTDEPVGTERPTRRNVLNGPERRVDRKMDDQPIFCRTDADDAYILMSQLQRPQDHVAELHRALQRAFTGRTGHLTPSDQRLMQMQSVLWPGANEDTDEAIIDFVVRFQNCELSVAEVRRSLSIAHRIVTIALEYVAAIESVRLALSRNEPLPNLARPVDQLESPLEWSEIEAPGPDNARWGAQPCR